jgi:hypothetical protein
MLGYCHAAGLAAVCLLTTAAAGRAQDASSPLAFFSTDAAKPDTDIRGSSGADGLSTAASRRRGGSGGIEKQITSVSTGCLKPDLKRILHNASSHFGSPVVITSGYRHSRSSYHGKCMAADVQISGVGVGALARYFRGQPGVGGVGTYGHTRSVHVDIAPRHYTWHHGRRKARYASMPPAARNFSSQWML